MYFTGECYTAAESPDKSKVAAVPALGGGWLILRRKAEPLADPRAHHARSPIFPLSLTLSLSLRPFSLPEKGRGKEND
jgi:hypothetical protein